MKNDAKPKEELKIAAFVTDPDGKPVMACVGASVVDDRVINLKNPLEVTPMDIFYEPTLRTMSTTGIWHVSFLYI